MTKVNIFVLVKTFEDVFRKRKVFSCEICKNFRSTSFYRTPPVAAFGLWKDGKHLEDEGTNQAEACNLIKKQTLAQVFFSVNFAKFLRTPFWQSTSGRLFLTNILACTSVGFFLTDLFYVNLVNIYDCIEINIGVW